MFKRLAAAIALAALATPCVAGSVSDTYNVRVVLLMPGAPPPPGVAPPASGADLCISQSLSDATGGVVQVVCRSGRFVSIESKPNAPFVGVHGGAHRYYVANAVPADLRYLGSDHAWIGSGTVTSIRFNYPEGMDGVVEMQVGF